MNQYANRLIRAVKLDPCLYEEVEADRTAMGQAMTTVALSSIAAGLINIGRAGIGAIVIGIILALAGWFLWAYLTYLVGTRLLPEPQTSSSPGELLRTIGFASAPGLIRILGIIPGLAVPVFVTASLWMLIAMVIAVRQALDYRGTGRAIGVCIIGWVVQAVIMVLLLSVFVDTAARTF